MAQHVKILAILHIVFSLLGLSAGLFALLFWGGIAGLVGIGTSDPDIHAIYVQTVLVLLIVLVVSLAGLIGGIGLLQLKSWARTLMIVVSGFDLLGVPFHTALGIYGLWVLLNRETEQLFVASSIPAAPRV